jgi:DNA-binding IclR family transcriptional regulator
MYVANNSVLKAVSILRSFTPAEPSLSASEISRKTGVPKMTTHRILATLTKSGLLEQDTETKKYSIGSAIYMMGSLYLRTTDIFTAAESVLESLNDMTSEVTSVGILEKDYITLIMRQESKSDFRWSIHIGSVFPAYASGLGRALLAELTDKQIDSLFPEERLQPLTPKTIATKTELKQELQEVRDTGTAFSRGEHYEGIDSIASVIRNASGAAIAALGFGIPMFKMTPSYEKRLATLLKLGSSLISYRLGYVDIANPVHNMREIISWWEKNALDS